jgi:hypothetical protein
MRSECAACGRRFTGTTAFDAHRQGDYTNEPPNYGRYCVEPAKVGLVQREDGIWGYPEMDDAAKARLAARRADSSRTVSARINATVTGGIDLQGRVS